MRNRMVIAFLVAGAVLAIAPLASAGRGAPDPGLQSPPGDVAHLDALLLDPEINPDGEAPDERILAKAEVKYLLGERSRDPRVNGPVFQGIRRIVEGWVAAVANQDDAVLQTGLDAYLQESLRSLLGPHRLGSLEAPVTTPIKSWIAAEIARQIQPD